MNPQELVNGLQDSKTAFVDLKRRQDPDRADPLRAINNRPFVIDAAKFAAYASDAFINALAGELLNTEPIKTAAITAVRAIREIGRLRAVQIIGAGVQAASGIEKATRQQADVLASRIRFTSW